MYVFIYVDFFFDVSLRIDEPKRKEAPTRLVESFGRRLVDV